MIIIYFNNIFSVMTQTIIIVHKNTKNDLLEYNLNRPKNTLIKKLCKYYGIVLNFKVITINTITKLL